jgi:cytidylate kinase
MKHIVIAIDGPAASGKGTLARKLAAYLGYAYLDTGALYRSVGKAVLDAGQNPADEQAAIAAAKSLEKTLKAEDLQDPALRTDIMGQAASNVAKFPGVREAMFAFQKGFAAKPPENAKGVILDGRDIGTVICPDADVKFFVTASTEERSKRRLAELAGKGIQTDYETVFADMTERDARDAGRDTAPLKAAPDSFVLDTSNLGEAEVMERALTIIVSQTQESA